MSDQTETYRVIIVGGGAVGLFLGLCLQKAGISFKILEKRSSIQKGSRSLGIHPVSLELFHNIGIAEEFTDQGIKISRGHAFANTQKLGTLSFEQCPKPYNFILALPQEQTESILQQQLISLDQGLLERSARVTDFETSNDSVQVAYQKGNQTHQLKADFLIGCDGKDSFVRQQSGISFDGSAYPDTYIMGDFSDNTDFGPDAAIFLCNQGLIESFPLHNNRRRWVAKTEKYIANPNREQIHQRLQKRIRHDISDTENFMLSSFGVQKHVAKPMVKGRVILAGDAAHIVSPIGGQGMNLGWLDAWDLSETLKRIFQKKNAASKELYEFDKRRQKAARNAIRRAEMNMRLGRKSSIPIMRNAVVKLMLNTKLSRLMANIFTMRGVERWII